MSPSSNLPNLDSKDDSPEYIETVSGDGNVAKPSKVMDTFRSYTPEFIRETEVRLRRRIDRRILPLVVIIYLFNYLDRNSITQARLHIHFLGWLYFMQLPSTLLMTKFRPSIFLPGCIILWASVSACTAAVNSPAGLLAVRFCLGLVEAPFFPGAIFYLSCWYTKRELGVRMALLICGLLLSNAFAGLISAGILSGMSGVGHLAAWRWLFILEGIATIILGVIALFLLPDYPGTTKWLTEVERIVAQGRLAADAGSVDLLDEEKVSVWKGVKWAVIDYRVWIFACLQMATTASISYSHFFPTLIKDIGIKNNTTVLLLTSPPYLVAFIWALGFAFHADRKQTRSPQSGISQMLAILGTVLLISVPSEHKWARYVFTFLVCSGTFGVYSTTYTWLSSTIPRPPVKRAAAIGLANTCANCASLFANYFWLDEYGPTYTVSWGCILAFQVLGLSCILALRLFLQRANRRFEKLAGEANLDDEARIRQLDDDSQRAVLSGFRYII